MGDYERYERALAGIEAPFAFVDLDAMWANGDDMLRRAARQADPGRQQVGALPAAAGAHPRARPRLPGLLTYTLPETLWLAEHGLRRPACVAYPTADRAGDRRARRG